MTNSDFIEELAWDNAYHDDADRQRQEQYEQEQWLYEREKEMVANIEDYMDKAFEYFFGGSQ